MTLSGKNFLITGANPANYTSKTGLVSGGVITMKEFTGLKILFIINTIICEYERDKTINE
jgi:hypothetical protein